MSEIPIENEVKIELNNLRKVNYIYDLLGRPKLEIQKNYLFPFDGKFLRLRSEAGKAYLTAKGKDSGISFNSRPEVEDEISLEFFNQFVKLADNSPNLIYYEKSRASAKYLGCNICLDNFFGRYYLEIEGEDSVKKKIMNMFGLQESSIEKRSYLEMLTEDKTLGGIK